MDRQHGWKIMKPLELPTSQRVMPLWGRKHILGKCPMEFLSPAHTYTRLTMIVRHLPISFRTTSQRVACTSLRANSSTLFTMFLVIKFYQKTKEDFGETKPTRMALSLNSRMISNSHKQTSFSSLSAVLGMRKQTSTEMELVLQTMYG